MSPMLDSTDALDSLTEVAAGIGRGSELLQAARVVAKRPDNVLGLLLRQLSREEIAVLEDRGCHADDWAVIQVAEDFNPFRVRRTFLRGACVLGRFDEHVDLGEGLSLPSGIYDCTLVDCQVGNNCLLEKVRFCSRVVIEHEAVVFDVGRFTCSGAAVYGCGQHLPVAIETGGREVPLWAELSVPDAAVIARDRADTDGQRQIVAAVAAYVDELRSPVCWVRRGAVVMNTDQLVDVYIGSGARIDHAQELRDVCLLSQPEEATVIGGGASLSEAVVQWGVSVKGHAIVHQALLCEHSSVDENAVVCTSIIGPNTGIAKGEVTASLVGPFVGFHHQSMLIAAYWPEGRGNIAYGAMVGSNHTGRAPDQELWAGEGMFFGLGCSIRYPSDFSQAPYSIVGAGVNTLAQKLTLPFSLLTTPGETLFDEDRIIPRAFNECLPGWGLYANAYGIERMELKFAKRDRARRHRLSYHVLRPRVMTLVRQALAIGRRALVDERSFYLDEQLPGLGKNFVRRAALARGVEAYARVLERYALRILLGEAEGHELLPGSGELAHSIIDELLPGVDQATRLSELAAIERANAEIVEASKATDDERGARIIPGYAAAHQRAVDDPVVAHAWQRVASTEARIAAVLDS